MSKEKTNKVKVKYPEIRKVLQKLYKYSYISGRDNNQEDGYDFSSAYEEIEKIIKKRDKKKSK